MKVHQPRARPAFLVAILALAVALASPLNQGADPDPGTGIPVPGVGDPALLFEAPDLTGKVKDVPAMFQGKVGLVVLWASWCRPCLEEIPKLRVTRNKYKQQGLEVLAVGIREGGDTVERQIAVARRYFMDYPTVFDEESRFQEAYGISALPFNMLIGRNGKIAWKGTLLPYNLETRVQELLAEPPPAVGGE